ncbi:MAG: PBP1A family penicillin-binding protein [Myxococcota bacterium]
MANSTEASAQQAPWARRFLRAVVRIAIRLVLIGVLVAGIAAAILFQWLDKNILAALPQDLSDLRQFRPPSSSLVYAADGTLIDEFYLERRIWVPLAELPPHVWRAFVAAEDRRFFEHGGFDLFGIARAFLANLERRQISQGGSTITQQLVKNLLVGSEKSYQRKLKEVVLAFRLDRNLSKEEILELYLNYVFLGSGNYGVEAAARDYFGVSARELNPGQAATLAGLVPAPSRYSPRTHPDAAAWRRSVVLRAMVEEHYLEPEPAAKYVEAPVLETRESSDKEGVAIAYATQVRRELRRILGKDVAEQQGLHVWTPLDLRIQAVAEQAVKHAVAALEDRQGKSGPIKRLERSAWESFLERAPGIPRDPSSLEPLPPPPGSCFEALVPEDKSLDRLRAGPFLFALNEADRQKKVRSIVEPVVPVAGLPPLVSSSTGARTSTSAHPAVATEAVGPGKLRDRVRPGDIIRVCVGEGGSLGLDPRPWPEGAAIVMETKSGRILAMVGGTTEGLEGFVRATQAERQPGSSFKPYVYTTALLGDRTQLDIVLDGPIALPAGGGKMWQPKNYDGSFAGPIMLRDALARSLNTVAVRLALEVGPTEVARVAHAMGVRTPLRKDITIALGSSEVTPMDQVLGYATLARMGVTTEPVYVDRVVDMAGNVVGTAGEPVIIEGRGVAVLPGPSGTRVIPAGVAYEVIDMLRQVVRVGTAKKAYRAGFDRAGKTGTTNEYVDAWFVGLTAHHVVAVWIGSDGTFSLGDKETGGRAALPAWIEIADALPEVEGDLLPMPDDAMLVQDKQQWIALPRGKVPAKALPVQAAVAAPMPSFGGED